MELKKCVFCGKSVVPELPHYEIGDIHICYHCGGYKTLFNLASLGVGFSVVMEEPIEAGSLPGQTSPHIVVENVDGDLIEKKENEPLTDDEADKPFRKLTYGRVATPDEQNPSYFYADFMREALAKKFGSDGAGIPKECAEAGYMNLCDFFTDNMVDYLLSDGSGGKREEK